MLYKTFTKHARQNFAKSNNQTLFTDVTEIGWQSFEGNTALMIACEQGNVECVKLLLDHKADPDVANHVDDFPLLAGKFIQIVFDITVNAGYPS